MTAIGGKSFRITERRLLRSLKILSYKWLAGKILCQD